MLFHGRIEDNYLVLKSFNKNVTVDLFEELNSDKRFIYVSNNETNATETLCFSLHPK